MSSYAHASVLQAQINKQAERIAERDIEIARLRAELAEARDLLGKVTIYGQSGSEHGDCANVPEGWAARCLAVLLSEGGA